MAMLRFFAGTSFITRPSMATVPEVMGSSPAIMRSTEDLPQPDGPSSTMNSPSAMVKLTSLTAGSTLPSYRLHSLSMVTVATPYGPSAHGARGHAADHGFGKQGIEEQHRRDRDYEPGGHHADIELMAAHEMHDAERQGALLVLCQEDDR